jgi:hypothetical protein
LSEGQNKVKIIDFYFLIAQRKVVKEANMLEGLKERKKKTSIKIIYLQ